MKQAFVLTSTAHGTMIVPRFDYKKISDSDGFELGPGCQCLEYGSYDLDGITLMAGILERRREAFGAGVVMIDGGANIGAVSVSLGRHMEDWGKVLSFEPQDKIFMALCGNIVLNGMNNVRTYRAALGRQDGLIDFPDPDYTRAGNFGGVSMLPQTDIGQKIEAHAQTASKRIDSLELQRLDFLKLDVEGMEIEALVGGMETLSRCRPVVMAEWIKCGKESLEAFFGKVGYRCANAGVDVVAAYGPNPIIDQLREMEKSAA